MPVKPSACKPFNFVLFPQPWRGHFLRADKREVRYGGTLTAIIKVLVLLLAIFLLIVLVVLIDILSILY